MRDALRDFAREIKRQHGLDFATRIGINSGDVVVVRIGDDLRMDYTAQGHTVGLAQRMESLATGGGIYVSANTATLAQGYLALDDLGVFTLKGVNEPMHVFEDVTRTHLVDARSSILKHQADRRAKRLKCKLPQVECLIQKTAH